MKTRTSESAVAARLVAIVVGAVLASSALAAEKESQRERPDKRSEAIVVEPGVRPEPVPPRPRPGFDVDIWTDRRTYEIGDLIRIYFRVTRPCYVYIFDTDTRGVTRQIFPNYFDPDNYVVPGRTYFIPDPSYKLRVVGPPGREELRIVAVRYRALIYERRHRFGPSDPFPLYPEGSKGFLREYKRERSRSDRERIEVRGESRPTKIRRRSAEAIAIEPGPRTIVIEEPPVVYERDWAEAYTMFHVVRPYWQPPPAYYGALRVSTRPPGARVYVDGRYRGRSPLVVRFLEPGFHSVRITTPGFYTWETEIEVTEGREVVVDVTLRPRLPRFKIDFRFWH